jgi:hypothetical protein
MFAEADFAIRQAFAFCPTNPEAIFRFVNLLLPVGRIDDALLVARTAAKFDPKSSQMQNLIKELDRIKKNQKTSVMPGGE